MILLETSAPNDVRGIVEVLPDLDRVRVRVERRHIEAAGHTGATCPIARALGGSVFITKVMVRKGDDMSAVAVLPKVARDFVEAFDNGRAVEPIEFDLQVG